MNVTGREDDDVARALPRSKEEVSAACQVSLEAAELFCSAEVIDLHVESFSFQRALGYDLRKRHSVGWNRAYLYGQADLPRLIEGGVGGALYSITANPLRPEQEASESFLRLVEELETTLLHGDRVGFAHDVSSYYSTRNQRRHVAFLAVQGATALGLDPTLLDKLGPTLVAVGLLHLTKTRLGAPSLRLGVGLDPGLSDAGFALLEELQTRRVFVDLAHIHPRGFWDAVHATRPDQPLLVSHTGVNGAHPHWRNLDDDALRAIADRGGVIGIIYHALYLGDALWAGRLASVLNHIEHAASVVGVEHVALGSDWDGLICTPRDMPTCLELPRLVQGLLDRGFSSAAILGILGQNFLRSLSRLRG